MSPVATALFDLVSAPFLIVAVLLVVAGCAKVHTPHGASRVLEGLGVPVNLTFVRVLGVAEVGLGIAVFVAGDRWLAVAMALAFALFAAVGVWLLVGPEEMVSCGCLGALDTPPSRLHVLLSMFGASAAGLAAVANPVRIDIYLGSLPAAGIPFLIAIAAGAGASVLVMAYVPLLASSYAGTHDG